MKFHYAADLDPAASVVLASDVDALAAQLSHYTSLAERATDRCAQLEAALTEVVTIARNALGSGAETSVKPRGKPCTCDSSPMPRSCHIDAGRRLGELWYCEKRYRASLAKTK